MKYAQDNDNFYKSANISVRNLITDFQIYVM